MTVACAGLKLQTIAKNALVDFICSLNMNKTFNVLNFFESNMTAKFVLGELWNHGHQMLSNKVREKIHRGVSYFPKIQNMNLDYVLVRDGLQQFNHNSWELCLDVCKDLLKSNASSVDKERVLLMMKRSPWCRDFPDADIIPSCEYEGRKIELTFYLSLVLAPVTVTESLVVRDFYGKVKDFQEISSKEFQFSHKNTYNPHTGYVTDGWHKPQKTQFLQTVHYNTIGEAFISKMNLLCTQVPEAKEFAPIIDNKFFGEPATSSAMMKASKLLEKIGRQNYDLVQMRTKSQNKYFTIM